MPRFWLLTLAVPLAACGSSAPGHAAGDRIAPSGSGDVRSYAVAGFTKVELEGSDDVDIRVGPEFSVRAEGPGSQLDKLDIRKDGDTLHIGSEHSWGMSFGSSKVVVHVTLPALAAGSLAGSGDMTVDNVTGGAFVGSIAGSGNLSVAQLRVDRVEFNIAGSGDISARGQAKALALSIAGSGDFRARGLAASRAEISMHGSGDVTADVDGPAQVTMAGSGDVDLGPKAQCRTTKSGSGNIRCGS